MQNAELEALHETSLGVMHRLDIDDLLSEVLARAVELLGTRHRLYLHAQELAGTARDARRGQVVSSSNTPMPRRASRAVPASS